MDGFKRALRLTLYRPRDILSLLNEAFLNASRKNSESIVFSDIDESANSISGHRLTDLVKEYESVFPAIKLILDEFIHTSAKLSWSEVFTTVDSLFNRTADDPRVRQDLAFFKNSTDVIDRLYHVGFLGLKEPTTSSFVFCHDGNTYAKDLDKDSQFLIHPCYWRALSIQPADISSEVDDIYDEYEIEYSSISTDQRNARIENLGKELDKINPGRDDAARFEEWCLDVVRILFAGGITNVELRSNANNLQQRDIIGTIIDETTFWRRIRTDYGTRQITFEVKNYADIGADEFRQVHSYLGNDYGRIGFIITRADSHHPEQGREQNWVRELWANHKILVVKLTAKFLLRLLKKLRNPQKHNLPDKEMSNLLDKYVRNFVAVKFSS